MTLVFCFVLYCFPVMSSVKGESVAPLVASSGDSILISCLMYHISFQQVSKVQAVNTPAPPSTSTPTSKVPNQFSIVSYLVRSVNGIGSIVTQGHLYDRNPHSGIFVTVVYNVLRRLVVSSRGK